MTMYDKIAHFYDLIHADLKADIDTILALAEAAGGPLLELGCGSGRILLPLARAGHQVVGIDNSGMMLTIAKNRLNEEAMPVQERVSMIEADMGNFVLKGQDDRFGLAIIGYNTFMHLDSEEKTAALKRVHQYLRPDSRLFIDLINPFAVAQTPNDHTLTLEKTLIDPRSGYTIVQMASNHLNEQAQFLTITWIYDAVPPEGGPIHRLVTEADYHYLFPHQLELLLQDTGFKLESLAGEYDQTPFNEGSGRLLITAIPN